MVTRREAIGLLGSMSAGTVLAAVNRPLARIPLAPGIRPQQGDSLPRLARGAPSSPERLALIEAFKRESEAVATKFEARTYTGDWVMPYRFFQPEAPGPLPLVVYLHGSGGLGNDNLKQMGLGNIFGTRVWALPENQKKFPCYVVAPQTDRGWVGDGARLAFEIIDGLRREFAIDGRRMYVTGQSMGCAGAWHMSARRPRLFAAAVTCCGSRTPEAAAESVGTPLWNFHGDADATVPPAVSRDRIAALRQAGGHPLATEYAGVGHNVWEWAYTEPALVRWVFAQHRAI
jgi:predicted peptidase